MKKLLPLLAVSTIILVGCNAESKNAESKEVNSKQNWDVSIICNDLASELDVAVQIRDSKEQDGAEALVKGDLHAAAYGKLMEQAHADFWDTVEKASVIYERVCKQ